MLKLNLAATLKIRNVIIENFRPVLAIRELPLNLHGNPDQFLCCIDPLRRLSIVLGLVRFGDLVHDFLNVGIIPVDRKSSHVNHEVEDFLKNAEENIGIVLCDVHQVIFGDFLANYHLNLMHII